MTRVVAAAGAIALALAVSACGEAGDADRETAGQKLADTFSPSAHAASLPAQSAQAFASFIAANNAYELAAARLAQQNAHDEKVRSFAAQMLQDHTVEADELRDALKRTHGVRAEPQMTAQQQRSLERLRKAGDFDDDYAAAEIAEHERELAALRDYADNGMDPALSEFAADAENMAADHLRQARNLS
jgi:putative membrane protein